MVATEMLRTPVERLLREVRPAPSLIISDRHLAWTADLAQDLGIPRILFDGMSCFAHLCTHNLHLYKPHEKDVRKRIRESAETAHAVIINSFEELEPENIETYRKTSEGARAWCIGPVSLCNKNMLDVSQRGNRSSEDESHLRKKWGGAWNHRKSPFIWVIRRVNQGEELEQWLSEDGFEERVKGRCLLIRGWAPQVLILSHPLVGGFLTHCGWNSKLEGISAGVPMVTWPLFAEQFYNEEMIMEVLRFGVGAKEVVHLGNEDEHGVMVKGKDIKVAVDNVMSEDEKGEERRKRAKKLAKKASKAVEQAGSSYLNIKKLIEKVFILW
ncbi:UDP-glycosyltransferase 73C6-like [Punica granatum]|uniref:UDP-glycosyltransferase 73C6-like n=1 Tax=Punica granatum TaxID=22663 RepID=A0A6P8DUC0_PUNGR|nr:UDP-glycosyltransferase 73C6-like [Punica granatum]